MSSPSPMSVKLTQTGQVIKQKGSEMASEMSAKAKEMNAKANKGVLDWLIGKDTSDSGNECVCGSDIKNRLVGRAQQIKWMWVVIVVLVLVVVIMHYKMKSSEPLYDYGIGQRREIQLDGLGSQPTFNERMEFTKQYSPEYSE